MIKENVNVSVVGGFISSMILYKTIVNIYLKSTHSPASLPNALLMCPSTRAKEIALFMLFGAPFVAGWMWTGNKNNRWKSSCQSSCQ